MSQRADIGRTFAFFDVERDLWAFPTRRPIDIGFTDRPFTAALYRISGLLMRILGPTYWAAIVVLFIYAELFTFEMRIPA